MVFSAASASSASDIASTWPPDQHLLDGDADLAADLAAHQLVVAGEHLDRDAVPAQGRDRRRGAVLGRVEEGDVAAQDQLRLVVLRVGRLRVEVR